MSLGFWGKRSTTRARLSSRLTPKALAIWRNSASSSAWDRSGRRAAPRSSSHGARGEEPVGLLDGDARRDAVRREDDRRRSFDDERASLADELHQLEQPFEPHAAADVVRLVLPPEIRRQIALFLRTRLVYR